MLRGIVGAAVVARLGIKRFLTASAALADGYRLAMGVCAALAVAASVLSLVLVHEREHSSAPRTSGGIGAAGTLGAYRAYTRALHLTSDRTSARRL